MLMKIKAIIFFLFAISLSGTGYAQPQFVRETNTPIALHYGNILKDYIAYIEPQLASNEDLVKISKLYFDKLGYRVILITIESTRAPKLTKSWKMPHTKLSVLPRMTCYLSEKDTTLELFDQGDDYIRIQNYTGRTAAKPG